MACATVTFVGISGYEFTLFFPFRISNVFCFFGVLIITVF